MEEENKISKVECPHVKEMKVMHSDKKKCEQCDVTENLRLCTSCGAVHCCESSNSHNTDHFKNTTHPIIKSKNTNYDFTWCYECEAYLK